MDYFVIEGGKPLYGEVEVSGAKNSALKLIMASLLSEGEHELSQVPRLADIDSALTLLKAMGVSSELSGHHLRLTVPAKVQTLAPYDIVRKMRASILVLGPLLARFGEARVSLPGGCAIGTRPIDLHIEALRQMGAHIEIDQGYVVAKVNGRLKGTTILFDQVTVGGTENVLMAATLAEGTTTIENAAKEPEIIDLANFLNHMGARIEGAGAGIIRVHGVEKLRPSGQAFKVMKDRIEAGTLLLAGAITGGEVTVKTDREHHIEALLFKLKESGFAVHEQDGRVTVKAPKSFMAVDVTTAPYPHFATDLQAQFMALMCVAEGTSVITETIFENRFMHVPELCRMGADITPKSRVAIVRGKPGGLKGAPVMATDLRASASLVLAALAAQGESRVNRIYHLDRGYEQLEQKLTRLGAKVRRLRD
jgi:UDP-N-acetylglucosamine 1-carboxyvinyltransferase